MWRRWQLLATGCAVFLAITAGSSDAHAETPAWTCTSDDDCFNPDAPYCDLESGDCVQCLVTDHCEPDFACEEHTCIPKCFDDTDCVEPTAHCDPEGLCVECFEDEHCPENLPHCALESSICVECIVDEDCPEDEPICAPGAYACAECLDHIDCPEDEYCSGYSCHPDVCEPGETICSEDLGAVLVCDEDGQSRQTQELCPGNSCVDGACQEDGGTETGDGGGGTEGGEETDAPTEPPGGGGSADDDGQGKSRGCGCALDEGSPVMPWMVLVVLFGLRRRASR